MRNNMLTAYLSFIFINLVDLGCTWFLIDHCGHSTNSSLLYEVDATMGFIRAGLVLGVLIVNRVMWVISSTFAETTLSIGTMALSLLAIYKMYLISFYLNI